MSRPIIPRSSYIIALLCTGLLFFFSALAALSWFFRDTLRSELNHQVEHIIQLSDTSAVSRSTIQNELRQLSDIDSSSIEYLSPEAGRQFMLQETGLDFLIDGTTPFSGVLRFKCRRTPQPDLLDLGRTLRGTPGVAKSHIQTDIFTIIRHRFEKLQYYLLVAVVLSILIALSLLASLYRLILHAERHKIKTMELVGARVARISRPYLWKFSSIALLAMALAIGGLAILYFRLGRYIPMDPSLAQKQLVVVGLTWIALLIVILGMSWSMIRKYLNRSHDELA